MPNFCAINVGPVAVKLLSEGDRIVLGHTTKKSFEPESLQAWALMCAAAEGGLVCDVGAYTGLFTIGARLLGAHVLAFEPMPVNLARARANCALNGVDDKINRKAISDTTGKAELGHSFVPFTSGASLVHERPKQRMTVDTLALDDLGIEQLAAMKVDVERGEPLVLKGARETLKRCRPELLIEVLGEAEGDAVLEALDGLGYKHAATLDVRNWLMMPK
jgi:FkbM family methyltransferase